jgi:hypothetical protein
MKYIGLSLSFCMLDLDRSIVMMDDVDCIIVGVACRSDKDWKNLLDQYERTYWKNNETARAYATYLRDHHKIYQPRLNGQDGPNIAHGHWIEVGDAPRGERPKERYTSTSYFTVATSFSYSHT